MKFVPFDGMIFQRQLCLGRKTDKFSGQSKTNTTKKFEVIQAFSDSTKKDLSTNLTGDKNLTKILPRAKDLSTNVPIDKDLSTILPKVKDLSTISPNGSAVVC